MSDSPGFDAVRNEMDQMLRRLGEIERNTSGFWGLLIGCWVMSVLAIIVALTAINVI